MAGLTQTDLKRQSVDGTLNHEKMETDFLNGADKNVTGGNNDATFTGLKAGVNPNDAVNKAQLDAAAVGAMNYKGVIDASDGTGVTLDGGLVGDFYYVSVAGTLDGKAYNIGDHLVVNTDITDFSVDGAGKLDIVDNTESSDILRDADIQNNLTTAVAGDVLDASQGKILKDVQDLQQIEIDAIEAGSGLDSSGDYIPHTTSNYIDGSTTFRSADVLLDAQIKVNTDAIAALPAASTDVFGEAPTVTGGSAVLPALANIPLVAGTARVYLNGLRQFVGGGNDYTINDVTGVITFTFNLKNPKDTVLVDYKY